MIPRMDHRYRWDPCVAHRGNEVDGFVDSHFRRPDRNIVLVAGAGFDPRSRIVAELLTNTAMRPVSKVRALLIQENRPNPPQMQLDRASANKDALFFSLGSAKVESIDVFASDGAVVGGRNIVKLLRQQHVDGVTDVIVDVSALSVGVSFPVIRYFVEYVGLGGSFNLHVFVAHDPCLDRDISPIVSDKPGYVHSFRGRATRYDMNDAARLWLPQLAIGMKLPLQRLYDFVEPHDTCPIFPFPSYDPRFGDRLANEYLTEIEDTWSVDARNIVYADEADPLDLYRTILRLDDLRKPVFAETGGSMLILSPLGSKLMALGAMMAALERNLPVAYLEAIDYEVKPDMPETIDRPDLIHLWLEGDVYPHFRPAILSTTQ